MGCAGVLIVNCVGQADGPADQVGMGCVARHDEDRIQRLVLEHRFRGCRGGHEAETALRVDSRQRPGRGDMGQVRCRLTSHDTIGTCVKDHKGAISHWSAFMVVLESQLIRPSRCRGSGHRAGDAFHG